MALKDHCKSAWSHVLPHDFCKLLIFNYHIYKIRYEICILTIKNAKLSGYYFYMNLNIWGHFKSALVYLQSVEISQVVSFGLEVDCGI